MGPSPSQPSCRWEEVEGFLLSPQRRPHYGLIFLWLLLAPLALVLPRHLPPCLLQGRPDLHPQECLHSRLFLGIGLTHCLCYFVTFTLQQHFGLLDNFFDSNMCRVPVSSPESWTIIAPASQGLLQGLSLCTDGMWHSKCVWFSTGGVVVSLEKDYLPREVNCLKFRKLLTIPALCPEE